METIIPTNIKVPTLQIEIPRKVNAKAVVKDSDMIDELREVTAKRIASYQQRLTNLYNMRVKRHAFRAGDLVLRKVFKNHD